MNSACGVSLNHINLSLKSYVCRGYESEIEFLYKLIKCFHGKMNRVSVCICDNSHGSCKNLPFCRKSGQSIFDVLVAIDKKYVEVELKLNITSRKKIYGLAKEYVKKFSRPCCDYTKASRMVVFKDKDIARKYRGGVKRQNVYISVLETICNDLMSVG